LQNQLDRNDGILFDHSRVDGRSVSAGVQAERVVSRNGDFAAKAVALVYDAMKSGRASWRSSPSGVRGRRTRFNIEHGGLIYVIGKIEAALIAGGSGESPLTGRCFG